MNKDVNRKMQRKAKLLIKIAFIVLAVFIGVIGFIRFVPGFDMYVVRSGSMKPAINAGDVIITGPVNDTPLGKIQPGTIVTFQSREALTTHSVISINGDTLATKGDANEDPDPTPISTSQVQGVYLFKLPYIGYATYFIRTKMGWWLTIILPTVVLVGFIIKDILKEAFRGEPQPRTAVVSKQPMVTKLSPSIAAMKERTIMDARIETEAARIVSEILIEIRAAPKIAGV